MYGLSEIFLPRPSISKKTFDHPFGPFADGFSEEQHKYGPFKPIIEARKNKPAK